MIPQITIRCKEMPNWLRRDPERVPHPHPRLWHENCPPTGSLGSLPEPGVWIVLLNPGRERKRISPGEVVFGPGAAPSWGCSVSFAQLLSCVQLFEAPLTIARQASLSITNSQSLLSKEIQPVHSEGDQPWDFFGRNDAKAETPVLWPPHGKS